ncbi:hypothetical protein AB4589_17730 [Vibrio sp. 10N.222.49.A3]|uniref:hypothetical protein n=1 Tax=Vibrio sp. 10N.222.49.A3 TaxID=3229611 RepID=UPI00354EA66C
MLSTKPEEARSKAINWFEKPFPTFKRLALFAASHENVIEPEIWSEWLCRDKGWWLWSTNTQRETMRLLVLQGRKLKKNELLELEKTILAGLPREMFRPDLDEQDFQSINERSIWLHLAKLGQGRVPHGNDAKIKYDELCAKYPEWKLRENEKDEFSHWMSGTGDPDFDSSREVAIAPTNRRELSDWLAEPIPSNYFDYEDNWKDVCKQDFELSFGALNDLRLKKLFPSERWRTALISWRENKNTSILWSTLAPVLIEISDSNFKEVIHSVAYWVEDASKQVTENQSLFIPIIDKILTVFDDEGGGRRAYYNNVSNK